MSDVNKSKENETTRQQQDANSHKLKFREALEKKRQGNVIQSNNSTGGPKVLGGQTSGNAPKIFRRKSGSA